MGVMDGFLQAWGEPPEGSAGNLEAALTNDEVAQLTDSVQLVAECLTGLRTSLIEGGFSEQVAEGICMMHASFMLGGGNGSGGDTR